MVPAPQPGEGQGGSTYNREDKPTPALVCEQEERRTGYWVGVIRCFSKTQAKALSQVGDAGGLGHQEGQGTGRGWTLMGQPLPGPKGSQGMQQTAIPLPSPSPQHQLLTAARSTAPHDHETSGRCCCVPQTPALGWLPGKAAGRGAGQLVPLRATGPARRLP